MQSINVRTRKIGQGKTAMSAFFFYYIMNIMFCLVTLVFLRAMLTADIVCYFVNSISWHLTYNEKLVKNITIDFLSEKPTVQ